MQCIRLLQKKLCLAIQFINFSAQKIDGITFKTYGIVIMAFSVIDQANKIKLFEKIFLVANVSSDVVFGMFFLILSGANIDFLKKEL